MGAPVPSSTADYLREARRLRSRYAGTPGRMQGALKDLAARHDAEANGERGGKSVTFVVEKTASAVCRVEVRRVALRNEPGRGAGEGHEHSSSTGATPDVTHQSPSGRTTGETPVTPAVAGTSVLGVSTAVANQFAREVEGKVEGGLLRYSARKRLLVRAGEIGIGRFDAMLIIASVLHAWAGEGQEGQRVPGADGFPWALLVLSAVATVGLLVL